MVDDMLRIGVRLPGSAISHYSHPELMSATRETFRKRGANGHALSFRRSN